MKRTILGVLFFLIFSVLAYSFIHYFWGHGNVLTIRRISLEVELAHNDYLRKEGLMGRTELDWNKGMLFIFPEENIQSFWMKNTLIPLSVAFIKNDGEIIQITHMQPDHFDGKLDTYSSQEKVRYALETNMGWFEKNGIQVGDVVHFSYSIKKMKGEY
ncbi:MAG TPA: DUF192 domain-containing protein [Deltaproteobacteria bacterium]|nr:DUF192 domain-containing protein [Deltaproteobacteria bacterium]